MSHTYEHPRPAFAVDLVIRQGGRLLLIRRGEEPFTGMWALPGGHVDPDETAEHAAVRELREETGVRVEESDLRLVGVFSAPGRDPRGWAVSATFAVDLDEETEATAGDDASHVEWIGLDTLPSPLAFDHDEIVARAQAQR